MNARIRELADKCRTIYHDGNGKYAEQFDEEKFAELIVRECANVAADRDALDIYEEIREHFGVEE